MPTTITEKIQKVSPNINEELIIDDTIYELTGGDEVTELFRLYDRVKDRIPPGSILKNDDGATISNQAQFRTHAYLVANSKNFVDAESYLYSINDVNAVATKTEILGSQLNDARIEAEVMTSVINSLQDVVRATNNTIGDLIASRSSYSSTGLSLVEYYTVINNFATNTVENIITASNFQLNSYTLQSDPSMSINYFGLTNAINDILTTNENITSIVQKNIPLLIASNNVSYNINNLHTNGGIFTVSGSSIEYTGSYYYDYRADKYYSGIDENEENKKELTYQFSNQFNTFDYTSAIQTQLDSLTNNSQLFLENANQLIIALNRKLTLLESSLQTVKEYSTYIENQVGLATREPESIDYLFPGDYLERGRGLISANKRYTLFLQNDGNLVIYHNLYGGKQSIWSAQRSDITMLRLEYNGNLTLWSGTSRIASVPVPNAEQQQTIGIVPFRAYPGSVAAIQDDGNFVLYDAYRSSRALWSTQTNGVRSGEIEPFIPLPPKMSRK